MEALLAYLLKSGGILTLFYLIYHFLLKDETFFKTNRHFLLSGILASLILPSIIYTHYVYVEPEPFNPILLFENVPVTTYVTSEPDPFDWMSILYWTYILVALGLLLRLLLQIVSLFKLLKNNSIKKVNGFNLVETNSNISPFSFFNYVVYNPDKYNESELNIILNHEKAHGKQLHSIDIIISELMTIFQWFNPFVWFYKKSIQQNLEFMADQTAINKVNCSKRYQHTLLKATLKPQYASITNNFYNSLIKKRIVMLNQSKSHIKNTWKYFVILPLLATFLMSFNVKTVEVIKENPSEATSLDALFFSDDIINEDSTQPELKKEVKPTFNTKVKEEFFQEPIKVKIDKNTTDSELKQISENLKSDGIDFSVKNLKRNSNNEIIALQIKYKDSEGNSGNYSLNSDNPINTFYFFKENDGSIGFASEQKGLTEAQRLKIEEARELARAKRLEWHEQVKENSEMKKEMMELRKQEMEARKKEMDERKEEIKIRIKEAKEKHKEAMETAKKNYQVFIYEAEKTDGSNMKRDTIIIDKNRYPNEKAIYIVDGEEIDLKDMNSIHPNQIAQVKVLKGDKAIVAYGERGKDGVIEIETIEQKGPWKVEYGVNSVEFIDNDSNYKLGDYSFHIQGNDSDKSNYFKGHLLPNSKTCVIDKNTNDKFLKAVKNILSDEGIDFKYSRLKRNKQGLITSIKISLTDENGNKASATWRENEKGIPNILIGKVKGRLTATSSF